MTSKVILDQCTTLSKLLNNLIKIRIGPMPYRYISPPPTFIRRPTLPILRKS